MCGIIGYVGPRQAKPLLERGIHRNLYRGYEGAGIALLGSEGPRIVRVLGPGSDLIKGLLREQLEQLPMQAQIGIGHNRWATHGDLTTENTHPHAACSNEILLVHNGCITNDAELRAELVQRGHVFRSHDSDTEVIAHMLEEQVGDGRGMVAAMRVVLPRLHGSFALVVLDAHDPQTLYVAKRESPLIIGYAAGEMFVASDPIAFIDDTDRATELEDGQYGMVTADAVTIWNADGTRAVLEIGKVDRSREDVDRGGYPYFMEKEIRKQPTLMRDLLREHLDVSTGQVRFSAQSTEGASGGSLEERLKEVTHLTVIACGSSYWASKYGEQLMLALAGLPVTVVLGSEFTPEMASVIAQMPGVPAVIVVSQSGTTGDMIAALKMVPAHILTVGIVNVVGSTIAHMVQHVIYTRCGTETGVASTKVFMAQALVFCFLALFLGRTRQRLSEEEARTFAQHLSRLPTVMLKRLDNVRDIRELAAKWAATPSMFFLGRGVSGPLAAEGALKLKEIGYIHAEAYASGEVKHGPLALVTPEFPSLLLCPHDENMELNLGEIAKLRKCKGMVIVLTSAPFLPARPQLEGQDVVVLPFEDMRLWPLYATMWMQFFAYYVALIRGHNPDEPRHLSKSVTVR